MSAWIHGISNIFIMKVNSFLKSYPNNFHLAKNYLLSHISICNVISVTHNNVKTILYCQRVRSKCRQVIRLGQSLQQNGRSSCIPTTSPNARLCSPKVNYSVHTGNNCCNTGSDKAPSPLFQRPWHLNYIVCHGKHTLGMSLAMPLVYLFEGSNKRVILDPV